MLSSTVDPTISVCTTRSNPTTWCPDIIQPLQQDTDTCFHLCYLCLTQIFCLWCRIIYLPASNIWTSMLKSFIYCLLYKKGNLLIFSTSKDISFCLFIYFWKTLPINVPFQKMSISPTPLCSQFPKKANKIIWHPIKTF